MFWGLRDSRLSPPGLALASRYNEGSKIAGVRGMGVRERVVVAAAARVESRPLLQYFSVFVSFVWVLSD